MTPEAALQTAMDERATRWDALLKQVRGEMREVRNTLGDGLSAVSLIVQIRALHELQTASLGKPPPNWQETIALCGIGAADVAAIRKLFVKLEAMN